MSVTAEDLCDFFDNLLGCIPTFTEDGQAISFQYELQASTVRAEIFLVDIPTTSGEVDGCEITILFCDKNSAPLNLDQCGEDKVALIFEYVMAAAAWGSIHTKKTEEGTTLVVLSRQLFLREPDIETEIDDINESVLGQEFSALAEEWLHLNSIVNIILDSPPEMVDQKIELLCSYTEGTA